MNQTAQHLDMPVLGELLRHEWSHGRVDQSGLRLSPLHRAGEVVQLCFPVTTAFSLSFRSHETRRSVKTASGQTQRLIGKRSAVLSPGCEFRAGIHAGPQAVQALVELNDVPRDALSERRGGTDVPAVT
eukprot:COSAG06_NODE_15668_length_1054_cov_1.071204_1_plen_128_part_10